MLPERAYFGLSRLLGRLLRATRYSKTRIVVGTGPPRARKHRAPYAAGLIWLSRPLMRVLGTGVQVLPWRAWVDREARLYEALYSVPVHVERDGTVVLPFLPGMTLGTLLEDGAFGETQRMRAIELAVTALVEIHGRGVTHGDAMAENVMVDLDAGVARWFDFETAHDEKRPLWWRRADDLRALLATCVLRTRRDRLPATARFMLGSYPDDEVKRALAEHFASVWRRPLTFHLGQAPLTFRAYRSLQHAAGLMNRGDTETQKVL